MYTKQEIETKPITMPKLTTSGHWVVENSETRVWVIESGCEPVISPKISPPYSL